MSADVTGLISWLRSWFDDIYQLKGQGGGVTVDDIYPVGSIYMTTDINFSPRNEFGGTWERIKGRFLIGCDDTSKYPCDSTGGTENVTLTANQSGIRAHGHGMAHTHKHRHKSARWRDGRTQSGTNRVTTVSFDDSSATGTILYTDYNEQASSKTTTDNNTASNATESHTNIPPYHAVAIWKRTA